MKIAKTNAQLLLAATVLLASGALHAEWSQSNPPAAPTPGSACVDFSGDWHGSCSTNGQTRQPDTVGITQFACETLQFGDQTVQIGGTNTSQKLLGPTVMTTILTAAWNAEKTEISGKYTIIQRQEGQSGQKYAETGVSMRLDGRHLITRAEGNGGTVQCSYDRD